ncbi:uncharacterized protein CTHT_0011160 [Thermochaetoides thermophila DSM 1495]|uniref:ATP-grasp domain-containing protein n=1 Tax=Chaetomium thermophilum (strain DSM 1495 / CBS 144.50 / IMI 039719) TaxID=759272 RepID=G0S0T4_CHATD|nr:hypothetical protein CTHT_0011160 [Thermochaetoides thermophila DSM 1495]EGS22644.1 hypothetical protein CTHT_0011160 [Thermochaetoides thermophila DSM 1495]
MSRIPDSDIVDPSEPLRLPTITLDTTISDLYRLANPSSPDRRIAWLACGTSSGVNLTPSVPRNVKYSYQDQAFISAPWKDLLSPSAAFQRTLAKKHLTLVAQRDAFIAGKALMVQFHIGRDEEEKKWDVLEAERTLSVLNETQRPEMVFCTGPGDLPEKVKEKGIEQVEYKIVFDDLERAIPRSHSLETHWMLNSKAALARSGLPTPKAEVIEPEPGWPGVEPGDCCAVCGEIAEQTNLPFIPPGCSGPRGEWLAQQTERIIAAVRAREVPFVFKTQQCWGGAGTWLVPDEEAKRRLLGDLEDTPGLNEGDGLLRKLLSLQTRENEHMAPGAILLMEMITAPKADYGLTFVVTETGEAVFLAAAEQMIARSTPGNSPSSTESSTPSLSASLSDDGNSSSSSSTSNESNTLSHGTNTTKTSTTSGVSWVGSTIHYTRQSILQERFMPLMSRIARWIHNASNCTYTGPVGADVLELDPDDDPQGRTCVIVDLNVRTCGSMCLPLLRTHFVRRGMNCAAGFSMRVCGLRRVDFFRRWRTMLEEGRMIILSWFEERLEEGEMESLVDVVIGAEDEEGLREVMRMVRGGTEEVAF